MKTDLSMPSHVAALRKQTGADRWDEMWEGDLHVPPSPNLHHQDFEGSLEFFLRFHWVPESGGKVYHQPNVAGAGPWKQDYRIPDLVLLLPSRFSLQCEDYIAGGPDVVVEIKSPGDESYAKLDFYARIGVREVWIIDRDSKIPEIYALSAGAIRLVGPAVEWHQSEVTGLEMKADGAGKLVIRKQDDSTTEKLLPE